MHMKVKTMMDDNPQPQFAVYLLSWWESWRITVYHILLGYWRHPGELYRNQCRRSLLQACHWSIVRVVFAIWHWIGQPNHSKSQHNLYFHCLGVWFELASNRRPVHRWLLSYEHLDHRSPVHVTSPITLACERMHNVTPMPLVYKLAFHHLLIYFLWLIIFWNFGFLLEHGLANKIKMLEMYL